MEFIDYYEILDLPHTADENEIKTAYRQLAKTTHPDKNRENNQATLNFQKLNEAYSTLSDTQKRRAYDLKYERQTRSNVPRFSSTNRAKDSTSENTAPFSMFSETCFTWPNNAQQHLLSKIREANGLIEKFKHCVKSTEEKATHQRQRVEEKREDFRVFEEKVFRAECEMKRKYAYGAGPSNLELTKEYRHIRTQTDFMNLMEAELIKEEAQLALLERQIREFRSQLLYWNQKRDAYGRKSENA